VTPEVEAAMQEFGATLMKYSPTFTGPISPEESVTAILETIHALTIEKTGAFVSHTDARGHKLWV
jgi:hypothetical protein